MCSSINYFNLNQLGINYFQYPPLIMYEVKFSSGNVNSNEGFNVTFIDYFTQHLNIRFH